MLLVCYSKQSNANNPWSWSGRRDHHAFILAFTANCPCCSQNLNKSHKQAKKEKKYILLYCISDLCRVSQWLKLWFEGIFSSQSIEDASSHVSLLSALTSQALSLFSHLFVLVHLFIWLHVMSLPLFINTVCLFRLSLLLFCWCG